MRACGDARNTATTGARRDVRHAWSVPPVAKVEPITTARALRGPFDYLRPDGVGVGSVLVVPFGNRDVIGVVVGLADSSELPEERLVAPRRVLDHDLPPELVELAGWMADEYCSTRARALALVSPPAGARAKLAWWARAGEAEPGGRPPTERQRALLEQLPRAAGADLPALRRLEARGLVVLERRATRRHVEHERVGARRAQRPPLTADQSLALAEIQTALSQPAPRALLLHGVTGSGKTEVYLRAAEVALEQGRGVIVLVPEIALTPQIVGRFVDRFGDTVAVLHSKLAAGERHDEWMRLRSGAARGLRRSALGGLRADRAARPDRRRRGARQLLQERGRPALRRPPRRRTARRAGRRAARRGQRDAATGERPGAAAACGCRCASTGVRFRRCRSSTCASSTARCIPTRATRSSTRRRRSCCSTAAAGRTSSTAARAVTPGRARNATSRSCCTARRPTSPVTTADTASACRSAAASVARCRSRVTARAPSASSTSLRRSATRSFASTPTFADRRRGCCAASSGAPRGILLGTQMVAKGHDFPDVTLGVVVDADGTLRFPDFRAEERTFALVTQLAGRAGRGPAGGRVIVQTLAPGAASIAAAARHDADGFLDGELARRAALRYPPFSHLIRIVCSAADPHAVVDAAAAIRTQLGEIPSAAVLGPAPLFRLRGRERAQLVIKGSDRSVAVRAAGAAVAAVAGDRARRGVAFSVDVDPQ